MRRRFRSYRKDARTGSLGRAVPLLLCTRGALTETVVVNVPTSSWLLLCLAIIGVAMTATAIVRADRLGFGNMLWFLSGWLTSELALFHLLYGTHDSLASVEEARRFAQQLRAVSRNAVVYAELPGAQHAWDVFRSVRAMESVQAVARFLEWVRASARPPN
jgi:predicted acyltransferase